MNGTVFLGHICICNPRYLARDIEQIADNGPRLRARWIGITSSPSVTLERDDEKNGCRDHEAVDHRDAGELHHLSRASYEGGKVKGSDETGYPRRRHLLKA
jgi:hypothetical protein